MKLVDHGPEPISQQHGKLITTHRIVAQAILPSSA